MIRDRAAALRVWLELVWWEHVPHRHIAGDGGWYWICRRCLKDMP